MVERRPAHHVLVVDDDASIRLLCRINLQHDGWIVREAATVGEARADLADRPFDVVLLDVHVGWESGIELAEELRRDFPRTAVAMLTGSVAAPTLNGIADAVIAKPFRLDELTQTVRALAEERQIQSSKS